jgi:retron-type reverse transcriptase
MVPSRRVRANAAASVDGVTWEANGQNLETANIQGLLRRLKAKRYRHQPILGVHIPKDKARTRPMAVSSVNSPNDRNANSG